MDVHACGHIAEAADARLCRHLLGEDHDHDFVRVLRGRRVEYDLSCTACLDAGDPPDLVVCVGCAGRVDDGVNGFHVGWHGTPGVAERPGPAPGPLVRTPLPEALRGALDLAPLPAGDASAWLVLTRDGALVRWDAGTGATARIAADPLPPEPCVEPGASARPVVPRLHVAPRGDVAAVARDHGRYGAVLDLATGAVTLRLDGGAYREDTVPFAVAFAEHEGRTVVVHRTLWDALTVSDAHTGAEIRTDEDGLLFYGALHVSPDGRRVAALTRRHEPIGAVFSWNLRRWLTGSDGPPGDALCVRSGVWDHTLCWVGDGLVAVPGIGESAASLMDGARVFEAATGAEVLTFAGPRGAFFSDGRRLYAAAPGGLEIWDLSTGERTATVPGFVPERLHAAAGELAGRDGDDLVRLYL
ncbi:hypothetical protein [Actinomadura flavalba]|uniref:hypothetical protein n=1 Tax=Actinomadura flavalba TaxID=1120938 RepID=UPI00036F8F27|nr:hypothetical protein [Actinomadura flavalba]